VRGIRRRAEVLSSALAAAALAAAVLVALQWRVEPLLPEDPYRDALPFRPRVSYRGAEVIVSNPGSETYAETELTLFAGWTSCRAWVGAVPAGETVRVPLHEFKYEDGSRFDPDAGRARLLEIKARMGGREVHRDLPPPP
jgi:hypothetical protein